MNLGTSLIAALCAALAVLAVSPAAPAWQRNPAVEFADMPADLSCVGGRLRQPGGITVNQATRQPYVATRWVESPLLLPNGVPPFGANGLAFNNEQSILFVANTANDTVVQIPVANGIPGTATVFTNSINGADGLIIDKDDNLWVAANQADEIVVVNPIGQAIAKLGDFDGLAPDTSPRGLLFPASLVFYGEFVYVTNLALDLRKFNPEFNAVDSQWAFDVHVWNVARISRHLPPTRGGLGR